jgi:hypothetical protein
MNWGVSAVLLPELHCSHFMGSIILLMMLLSLIQQMIEVRNVNWGGYYPGGRRSILACLEHVQSEVNKIYSADNVAANSNAGVNGDDSDDSNSDDEGDDSFEASTTTATATTARTATRAIIATPVTWGYTLRTASRTTGAYPKATQRMHTVWIF